VYVGGGSEKRERRGVEEEAVERKKGWLRRTKET
jgi:hypothetical protein